MIRGGTGDGEAAPGEDPPVPSLLSCVCTRPVLVVVFPLFASVHLTSLPTVHSRTLRKAKRKSSHRTLGSPGSEHLLDLLLLLLLLPGHDHRPHGLVRAERHAGHGHQPQRGGANAPAVGLLVGCCEVGGWCQLDGFRGKMCASSNMSSRRNISSTKDREQRGGQRWPRWQ